jgi:chemotaxis protein CheD
MIKPMPGAGALAEIYLNPGNFHFGGGDARIHTLLGSCVSITLWHPLLHIGGMCHFLLSSRQKTETETVELDGRYGDEAVLMFRREIARFNTRPGEYQTKIFGGGNMFHALREGKASNIAESNITQARTLLQASGFGIHAEDVGGNGHRRIIFNLINGDVWVRHEKTKAEQTGSADRDP